MKGKLTDWFTGYLSVVCPGVPGAEQQLGLGAGAEPLHADVHGEQVHHPQGTTHLLFPLLYTYSTPIPALHLQLLCTFSTPPLHLH